MEGHLPDCAQGKDQDLNHDTYQTVACGNFRADPLAFKLVSLDQDARDGNRLYQRITTKYIIYVMLDLKLLNTYII